LRNRASGVRGIGMQISTEGKIGLALGLFALAGAAIGLAGAGMQMLAPAYTQIGWILIVSGGITFTVAIIGAVALTFHHFGIRRQRMIPAIGMVVISVVFLAWYFWPVPLLDTSASNPLVLTNGPLSGLTNAQLRERAISFVQTLRDFENTFEKEERRRLMTNCQAVGGKLITSHKNVHTPLDY
jgi:hypothetical protein